VKKPEHRRREGSGGVILGQIQVERRLLGLGKGKSENG